MMSLTLYGIPNCDQVKKARSWIGGCGLEFEFHDFRKAGVSPELIQSWLKYVDSAVLINRKGTTWRKLSAQEQSKVIDDQSAIACMVENPSVIKRPVLVIQTGQNAEIIVGFSEENYRRLLRPV